MSKQEIIKIIKATIAKADTSSALEQLIPFLESNRQSTDLNIKMRDQDNNSLKAFFNMLNDVYLKDKKIVK